MLSYSISFAASTLLFPIYSSLFCSMTAAPITILIDSVKIVGDLQKYFIVLL